MKDYMTYKDFIGSVHYNSSDEVFYGKIEEIDDLVTFEGKSVSELKKSFQEGVDDYILICQQAKKPMLKSFKGSFNVRINPELHRKAYRQSILKGMSLNQLVQTAIEKEIGEYKNTKATA